MGCRQKHPNDYYIFTGLASQFARKSQAKRQKYKFRSIGKSGQSHWWKYANNINGKAEVKKIMRKTRRKLNKIEANWIKMQETERKKSTQIQISQRKHRWKGTSSSCHFGRNNVCVCTGVGASSPTYHYQVGRAFSRFPMNILFQIRTQPKLISFLSSSVFGEW